MRLAGTGNRAANVPSPCYRARKADQRDFAQVSLSVETGKVALFNHLFEFLFPEPDRQTDGVTLRQLTSTPSVVIRH